ncbi:hypothetical protein, partial [Sansalvadorimonas verongulae]|uniref:hypothetical protein n=1 Tax=Sansalvadorimonas verongulae TaxID=2172824 RepID=UPI001E4ED007
MDVRSIKGFISLFIVSGELLGLAGVAGYDLAMLADGRCWRCHPCTIRLLIFPVVQGALVSVEMTGLGER